MARPMQVNAIAPGVSPLETSPVVSPHSTIPFAPDRNHVACAWWMFLSLCAILLMAGSRHPRRQRDLPNADKEAWVATFSQPQTLTAASDPLRSAVEGDLQVVRHTARLPVEYEVLPIHRHAAVRYPPHRPNLAAVLSVRPRIEYYPRLLSDEECDLILRLAEGQAKRRGDVFGSENKRGEVSGTMPHHSNVTSVCWLDLLKAGPLGVIRKRLTSLIGVEWSERMQVVHYKKGDWYSARHAYEDTAVHGDPSTSNNAAVFMLTLQVKEVGGGGVAFPQANGAEAVYSEGGAGEQTQEVCGRAAAGGGGIVVRPHRASGTLLYSMRADYTLDTDAVHAGCPLTEGEVWVAYLWFRASAPFGYGVVK